ncbi:hypothetical protein GJ496_007888, partial [Pomphorhynchus laevis]
MLRGNIGGAVRTLDGKASFGKCLKLNEKVGQLTVKQALSEKHPHGENLHKECLIKHSIIGTLPFHVTLFNQITGADIVSMAKKTTGAARPSVTNTGVELLGCPIGSAEYEKSWLDDKIENWMIMIQRLAEIAKIDPQLAYSAYMVSLQHKWTHIFRACRFEDGKRNYQVEENWHKVPRHVRLSGAGTLMGVFRGNIGGAVRTLDGKASFGKCLKLNEKVGQLTVKQALSEKHPHGENLHKECLIKHSIIGTLPFHVTLFNQITGADIVSMAKKTTGAARPSGVDAQTWKQMLISFDRDSDKLAE